ncbi:hypothetical protein ACFLT8_00235 [Chloroflexota bacterium]
MNAHLLDRHVDDEEVRIRSIEFNQNWMLFAHSKLVGAKAVRLKNVLDYVGKTSDFGLAERVGKEVRSEILNFADYLIKHRFESIEDLQVIMGPLTLKVGVFPIDILGGKRYLSFR